MIIGQFGEAFPPINDGVAQVIKNYSFWLAENNDKCYAVIPKLPNLKNDYNFNILSYNSYRVPFKKEYRTGIPKLDSAFYNKVKSIAFDIVHSHSPFSSGKLGIQIAKQKNIPCIMTLHTKFRDVIKNIAKSEVITDVVLSRVMRYFNMADDVWTVSESCVEILRQYGYQGEIFVMENGCDFNFAKKLKLSFETINNRYNIAENQTVLCFVGRMEYYKNIKMIIDALKIIDSHGYDFRMLFVGYGDKKHKFEEMVDSYNLKHKVTFTGNINDRELLKEIYLRSTALLFPSVSDMSSLVLKEAAAMKCPAVLVKNATTAQGIKDGINGFLIDNNAYSLAGKTEIILDNPSLAVEAGKAAYNTIFKNWEQIVQQVRERYLYVIERGNHSVRND